MELLFSLIALTTIWVMGIKIVTGEGFALERLWFYGERKAEEGAQWIDPVFYCQWCMPSIHSSFSFAFALLVGIIPEWEWRLLLYYPFVVAGSSLAGGLIWQYHTNKKLHKELMEAEIEKTEHEIFFLNINTEMVVQEEHEQTNN